MAEGASNMDGKEESWESWLGGWMQTAKEKSQTAYEFVKKDLAEFGCTVQKETEKAVEITKGSLHSESTTEATKKVKAGLASFLDNISKVLVIPHDDDDYIPMKVAADGSGLYDRGKARLHALQLDASTYMDPPRGAPEQYSMWLESFSLEQHKGEISELLVSKVEVRALYTKLVPSEVSNADFWQRYFYRVHQLQCDEARKQALMMRADQAGGKESVSWDDDDDEDEDDGNHSDWEKMPRPPQSYAAQQNLPLKDQDSTISQGASLSKASESQPEPQATNNKDHSELESSQPSDQARPVHKKQAQAVSMETSVTAFAAEPNLETSTTESISSHNVDASGESSGWSAVEVSANPWSLHIPEDLASASDAAEDDARREQVARPSASPCSQSSTVEAVTQRNEGSAAGAEVIPETNLGFAPDAVAAGGAASDAGPQQDAVDLGQHPLKQPAEISTAGPAETGPAERVSAQESSAPPEVNAEASKVQVSKPASQPEESEPAYDSSCGSGESEEPSQSNPHKNETAVAEKPIHTVAVPQPAQVGNPKETEFVPLGGADSRREGAEPSHSTAGEDETKAEAAANKGTDGKEIGMRVKGDMVVIGDRDSPSSTESTDTKDLGLDEDWEQDFDVEITEDDLKAAEDIAKRLGENLDGNDDDWENWE
ncbi:BSD domain-containing protein 1 [Plakobranchus ocellatus]|uniref:BSD domain-containing protein 1 n=1 Tax=Plakobranchus ocellatus TaxID=259542 RepID=A0AAV4CYX6_9GAST|nr:BSD domain-containing protein 1 [Plakobranchus ocellatus]